MNSQSENQSFDIVDDTIDTEFTYFDWSSFYDPNEQVLVNEALNDMGFGIFEARFAAEKCDLEAFMLLKPHHICEILKGVPQGIVAKFEKAYAEWKDLNGQPIVHQLSTQSSQQACSSIVSKGFLMKILETTDAGKKFLNDIDRTTPFDSDTRVNLIKIINSYCACKKLNMGVEQIGELSHQIEEEFPYESKDNYFKHSNGKASGSLYVSHNNMLKKLRSNNLIGSRKRKREKSENQETEIVEFTQEEKSSNDFVQRSTANVSIDILLDHWRKSSRIRLDTFRTKNDENIISLYRALQRPDASLLIDIDLDELHPQHLDFKLQWEELENKMINILKKELKTKSQIQKLNDMKDMTTNQKVAVLISSLHFYLYTPKLVYGTKTYKSSINDTIQCMLFLAKNENTMEIDIQQFETRLQERKLNAQAYIIGFGDDFENISDKFCVRIENIQYVYQGKNALLASLEILIKIYHVVNLKYPELDKNVYAFLSHQFMNISSDDYCQKVNQLMNLLKFNEQ